MPFRLWFYLSKLALPACLAIGLLLYFVVGGAFTDWYGRIAYAFMIVLALVGAIMGGFLALDKLKLRCPYCGKSGRAGGNREDGLWMECESCGYIHGTGPFRLKIGRHPSPKDRRRC